MNSLRTFWNDEQGQDLVEYSLLLASIAMTSAALFLTFGGNISGIWSTPTIDLAGSYSAV